MPTGGRAIAFAGDCGLVDVVSKVANDGQAGQCDSYLRGTAHGGHVRAGGTRSAEGLACQDKHGAAAASAGAARAEPHRPPLALARVTVPVTPAALKRATAAGRTRLAHAMRGVPLWITTERPLTR